MHRDLHVHGILWADGSDITLGLVGDMQEVADGFDILLGLVGVAGGSDVTLGLVGVAGGSDVMLKIGLIGVAGGSDATLKIGLVGEDGGSDAMIKIGLLGVAPFLQLVLSVLYSPPPSVLHLLLVATSHLSLTAHPSLLPLLNLLLSLLHQIDLHHPFHKTLEI